MNKTGTPEIEDRMNILVTGAEGLLGQDIVTELQRRGHKTIGTYHIRKSSDPTRLQLDIMDRNMVHT